MKKLFTILFIGLLPPFLSNAQQEILRQYFDGADTSNWESIFIEIDTSASNVWQIGPPQKNIFDSAASLPNAIVTDTINYYPPNNTSSFSYGINLNMIGYGILAIQWKQMLDLDSGFDGGIIEISADSGLTWENAFDNPYVYNFYGFDTANVDTFANGEIGFSGTDSTWKDIWLCFDNNWLSITSRSLQVRYTLKSDSVDHAKEGWLIDNISAHMTYVHTINEKKLDQYMTVSPNPSKGRVYIETEKQDGFHIIEKIELVNMEGRVVQQWGVSPTKFFVDISAQPDGIYVLKVTTNKKIKSFKILLEK